MIGIIQKVVLGAIGYLTSQSGTGDSSILFDSLLNDPLDSNAPFIRFPGVFARENILVGISTFIGNSIARPGDWYIGTKPIKTVTGIEFDSTLEGI